MRLRACLLLLTTLVLVALAPVRANAQSSTLYIGTYTKGGSKGIYRSQFNNVTALLSPPDLVAETTDPSFLALHPTKPFLYAVNESGSMVSAFSIGGAGAATGKLTLINQQSTTGAGPCHLALDATGRMLVVANYDGGSIASFPVDAASGKIGPQAVFIQFKGKGADAERQSSPHAHSVTFTADNKFVLIDDLGTDRTMIYAIQPETAGLKPAPQPFAVADPGAGPRHLAIAPNNHFVYVLNEIQSSVTRFSFNASTGAMRKIDTVSTLPHGFHGANTSAEIAIDKAGKTLYASNRGNDTIAVFSIDTQGALHLQQNAAVGGQEPRSFTLDPTGHWLLVANQNSSSITLFPISEVSGQLRPELGSTPALTPVCLLFAH